MTDDTKTPPKSSDTAQADTETTPSSTLDVAEEVPTSTHEHPSVLRLTPAEATEPDKLAAYASQSNATTTLDLIHEPEDEAKTDIDDLDSDDLDSDDLDSDDLDSDDLDSDDLDLDDLDDDLEDLDDDDLDDLDEDSEEDLDEDSEEDSEEDLEEDLEEEVIEATTFRSPDSFDAEDKVRLMAEAADAVRAEDIIVLDLRELTIIADFFMICTGKSSIQLRAIADRIEDKLRDAGIRKPRMEGYQEATWILLDYGDVVVHVMAAEQREFYRLEEFWAKAPHVELQLLPPEARSTRRRALGFDSLSPITDDDDDDDYEDDFEEDEDDWDDEFDDPAEPLSVTNSSHEELEEDDETNIGKSEKIEVVEVEADEDDDIDDDLLPSDFEIDPDAVIIIDDDYDDELDDNELEDNELEDDESVDELPDQTK